ncbi:hypothetical protein ACN20G_01045 [Streptomyces sp. BI20]|uniref:hypothetical protein n=1 Tax=Streptomyces sp. BI20 TaxID=3403460 RepID=UPI003C784E54
MAGDDHPEVLVRPLSRAPWREIISYRWSCPRDRALVLTNHVGESFVLGRSGDPEAPDAAETSPEASGAPPLTGRYASAHTVFTAPRVHSRRIGLPSPRGPERVDLWVSWWVHDPVRLVLSRTVGGWFHVRDHLTRELRHLAERHAASGRTLTAGELARHFAAPLRIGEVGLGYRLVDVRGPEDGEDLDLVGEGTPAPFAWRNVSREEFEFCLRVLREGPLSLTALWLTSRPEEVQEVLRWSVEHAKVLAPADGQGQVAELLAQLSPQERAALSGLLRERVARMAGGSFGSRP